MEAALKAFLITVVGILAPVHAIMLTAGFLIFADLITGIIAARKKGQKVTSSGLRRTISKTVVYQLAIITAFVVEKYMLSGVIPISSVAAATIGMVELKSILENLEVIYGQNLFATLLNKLGSQNDQELEKRIKEAAEKLSKGK